MPAGVTNDPVLLCRPRHAAQRPPAPRPPRDARTGGVAGLEDEAPGAGSGHRHAGRVRGAAPPHPVAGFHSVAGATWGAPGAPAPGPPGARAGATCLSSGPTPGWRPARRPTSCTATRSSNRPTIGISWLWCAKAQTWRRWFGSGTRRPPRAPPLNLRRRPAHLCWTTCCNWRLRPFFGRAVEVAERGVDLTDWGRPWCPFCGAPPDFARVPRRGPPATHL